MGQFNFGKKVVICGHVFWLDPGNPKYQEKAGEFADRIREASTGPKGQEMKSLIAIYQEIFDLLLGTGAFDTIFENRQPNAFDLASVMNYLTEEMGGSPKQEEPVTEDNRSETRVLLDEILDGMDDTQLAQMITIAGALK